MAFLPPSMQWITRPGKKIFDKLGEAAERRYLREKLGREPTREDFIREGKPGGLLENVKKWNPYYHRTVDTAYWIKWLVGDAKSPEEAARTGQGFIGGINSALSQTLSTIKIKPHPDFQRFFLEYQRRSRKGLAEVLIHRVSNILSIVRRDLKNNNEFRYTIMQAAAVSLSMYRSQSTAATKIGIKKRYGQLLLEWAHGYGEKAPKNWIAAHYKYNKMARGILPKPTPKLEGSFESSTKRFIRKFGSPNARINRAAAWYRGVITGSAEGLITSARQSYMVDNNSRSLARVERHWRGAINHKSTPAKAKRQGWAELKGSPWFPRVEVTMRGSVPYKLFPSLITKASKEDAWDMRDYIRKMNRGR